MDSGIAEVYSATGEVSGIAVVVVVAGSADSAIEAAGSEVAGVSTAEEAEEGFAAFGRGPTEALFFFCCDLSRFFFE